MLRVAVCGAAQYTGARTDLPPGLHFGKVFASPRPLHSRRAAPTDRPDTPVPGPPLNDSIRLACLVLAGNAARRAALADLLGADARVALVDEIGNAGDLPARLHRQRYDLAVVAPEAGDEALPWPLGTASEDAPAVLVVPPLGQDPDYWAARGAADVVGLPGPETMRHAIGRALEERAGHVRVRATLVRLGDERALSDALFEGHPHALALVRGETLLRGNRRFDTLIGAERGRDRELRWRGWLDACSSRTLAGLEPGTRAMLDVGTRGGRRHRVRIEPLGTGPDAALLVAIEPDPLQQPVRERSPTDPATGLLVRDALVERFAEMLIASRASCRYTAMRVRLSGKRAGHEPDGVGRTFEDLLVLRAAEALKRRFRGPTLLGRSGRSALLVVRPGSPGESSRDLAGRVRETLGSLGGFIDCPSAVRIDTLTLRANSLSARSVVERLERRETEDA